EVRARAQARIRSQAAARANLGIFQVAEGQHLGASTEAHVAHHAVRADAHAVAEPHSAFEHAVHVDGHVASAFKRAAHIDASGIGKAYAVIQQTGRFAALERALEGG